MTTLEFAVSLAVLAFLCAWCFWVAHTEHKVAQRVRPERAEDYDIAGGSHTRVVGPLDRKRLP